MKFSYIDMGNYLRGLMVLIRRDNFIHENERALILKIGERLEFESKNFEKVVDEFLKKKKYDDSPIKFSTKESALKFINDAIDMAFSDDYFHVKELEWLNEVAAWNKISKKIVIKKINEYLIKYPEKEVAIKQ